MANTAGFFGFRRWGVASGPPNFAFNSNPPYRIAAGYSTAIFFGDAVRMNYVGPTGFVETWVVGDGAGSATRILAGIFVGCQYFSTGQQKTVWNRYWPGSDATGDVTAYVIDDPEAQFVVQANSGPINYTNIGQNVDIVATPVGNTTTGISGMSIGTPTTTATLPFKVMNLVTTPPTANGSDITTANNYVIVSFNNLLGKVVAGV